MAISVIVVADALSSSLPLCGMHCTVGKKVDILIRNLNSDEVITTDCVSIDAKYR